MSFNLLASVSALFFNDRIVKAPRKRPVIMLSAMTALLCMLFSCSSGPSDSDLQTQLNSAISASAPDVQVSVKDKVVTLSGTCPDEACKSQAETSAKNVKGVKSVTNNIVVNAPPPAAAAQPEISADSTLQTSLNSLLSAYKTVKGTVSDGVVTLTGQIKRAQLTPLMQSVNELKPKKVENKLVIK